MCGRTCISDQIKSYNPRQKKKLWAVLPTVDSQVPKLYGKTAKMYISPKNQKAKITLTVDDELHLYNRTCATINFPKGHGVDVFIKIDCKDHKFNPWQPPQHTDTNTNTHTCVAVIHLLYILSFKSSAFINFWIKTLGKPTQSKHLYLSSLGEIFVEQLWHFALAHKINFAELLGWQPWWRNRGLWCT